MFENDLAELDAAGTLAAAEVNEHTLITAETRRLQIAAHWADLHPGDAVAAENVGDPIDGGFEPKGIASGSAGDDQLEAVLGCAAESHEAFLRRRGSPLFRGFRVGVNDRGLHQGLQPAEGDRTQRRGDALVDEPGLLSGELPGCCGDVAGLVGGHLPSQSRRPDAGKPVPQIKSVGDQAGG